MELSLLVIVVLCLFFFVAGFVDSVAGGGGLISTPAMLLCGLPPHTALGTGKFASTLGSLTSLWTFARNHLVVLRIAPAGFVSAFVGGMAGSGLAMHVDSAMLGKLLIFLLPRGNGHFPVLGKTRQRRRRTAGKASLAARHPHGIFHRRV